MIKLYYRWSDLDNEHEYGVELPLYKGGSWPPYWNYWVWYYIGNITNGQHIHPFRILPFANTWDEKCKLIKIYTDTRTASKCADRIIKFINKHHQKLKNKKPQSK